MVLNQEIQVQIQMIIITGYVYMAFAEEPFVANVGSSIPATAR